MRCVYCYGDGGEYAGKGMMSEETAFRAVDWLIENTKSSEKVNICFFGGEPLLNFTLMKKA
ncbi:MAG: nif11-like peptide radical SAM maturase, partial [Candidatus Tectomicrobia bacterium]|nr:nif11-like peptide radical SAM maturase [Candidatus Tectomicrobia bacterium]